MLAPIAALVLALAVPVPADDEADLPVVVLVGDSIRLGYAPYVAERLEGKARVVSPRANGGDSNNVRAHLDEWVIAADPDVVHLNAGLHDLKYDAGAGTHQVEPDAYAANLEAILDRLESETDATLIFATTTPVIEERHNAVKPFQRLVADVDRYNEAARRVLESHPEVAIDDLHAAVVAIGPESALVADGVHYTPAASRQLAERVVESIERALAEREDGR